MEARLLAALAQITKFQRVVIMPSSRWLPESDVQGKLGLGGLSRKISKTLPTSLVRCGKETSQTKRGL